MDLVGTTIRPPFGRARSRVARSMSVHAATLDLDSNSIPNDGAIGCGAELACRTELSGPDSTAAASAEVRSP